MTSAMKTVPRTAATAFGVLTSICSPGRILSLATATATLPESRSTVERPGTSVIVSAERSRTVTTALPPRRSRARERSPVTTRSLTKTSSLNFSATGCAAVVRAAVTLPSRVVTTPAFVVWAKTGPGSNPAMSDTATIVRPTRVIAAPSPQNPPGWAPETRDRCINRYQWPALIPDYRRRAPSLSSVDQIRFSGIFLEVNERSSRASPASETRWSGDQRWLRVATMGRALARLYGQIRKYLVGIAAAAVTLGLILFGAAERWELLWFDQLFELRGMRTPTAPIVIVTIDESTFSELNLQWPFPRALHGKVIDRIAADRPLAIGIDVLFDSESRFGPPDDAALSAAIARAGSVVLGLSITQDAQVLVEVGGGKPVGTTRELVSMPLPIIRQGAVAVAPVNVEPDPDSHVRRVPVRRQVPDPMKGHEWWLAFDAELHRLVTAKLPPPPLPEAPEILVNFRGPLAAFERIPYYRVVANEIPPDMFRDKVVLIGSTSEVMHDVFATAFARAGTMPGVAIHAN